MAKSQKKGALKASVISRLRKNKGPVVSKLMDKTGKSYPAICRWIQLNTKALTLPDSLEVICKELGMTQKEVLA